MKPQKKGKEWWIVETGSEVGDFGPYNTKAEAAEDIKGLERFEKYGHMRSFFTAEKKEKHGRAKKKTD